MRPVAALTAVVLAGPALAAPPLAQAVERISATPKTIDTTDVQTVRGAVGP